MSTLVRKVSLPINYKGKMFKQPKCEFEITHTIPDGDSPEETAFLQKAYKKLFDAEYGKLEKKRATEIRKAMDQTEKDITKKPPKNMDEFLKTAEKMIAQGIKVLKDVEVPKIVDKCISKVYDALEKKLKRKINRKKAKTVLKVVVLVLFVLAVAAVGVATAVVTGGSTLVVAGAIIGTVLTGVIGTVKAIKKGYDDYNNHIGKIEKDLKNIEKAIAYQEKKASAAKWRKLGPKEKIKLLASGTGPHIKSLKKHIDLAEAKSLLARKQLNQTIVDLNEAQAKFDEIMKDAGPEEKKLAAEGNAELQKAKRAHQKMQEPLDKFNKLKEAARKEIANYEKNGDFDAAVLAGPLKFAQDHSDTAMALVKGAAAVYKVSKKLSKALEKAAKAAA